MYAEFSTSICGPHSHPTGGEYSGFQVTARCEWGPKFPQKSLELEAKPPKIPGPK